MYLSNKYFSDLKKTASTERHSSKIHVLKQISDDRTPDVDNKAGALFLVPQQPRKQPKENILLTFLASQHIT
jgi:hypothetical protein